MTDQPDSHAAGPVTGRAGPLLAAAPPPLTPGEALAKLFLDNADRGCNADNDVFVEELLTRRRAIQALANPTVNDDPPVRGAG